jgi:hypothetical protein
MVHSMKWFAIVSIIGILLSACASTELTHTWVDENYKGKVFSKFLVIGVSDEVSVRRSFETKFVKELTEAGVDAVSSANAIDIPEDKQLEKEPILEAVRKYQCDAVIITHLVGVEQKDVYTYDPPTPYYGGYFGHYHSVYAYVHTPGYYTTHTYVRLETNVYDVETEKPVWSGQSKTWETGSKKKTTDEVIEVVVRDMKKYGLLPKS